MLHFFNYKAENPRSKSKISILYKKNYKSTELYKTKRKARVIMWKNKYLCEMMIKT